MVWDPSPWKQKEVRLRGVVQERPKLKNHRSDVLQNESKNKSAEQKVVHGNRHEKTILIAETNDSKNKTKQTRIRLPRATALSLVAAAHPGCADQQREPPLLCHVLQGLCANRHHFPKIAPQPVCPRFPTPAGARREQRAPVTAAVVLARKEISYPCASYPLLPPATAVPTGLLPPQRAKTSVGQIRIFSAEN